MIKIIIERRIMPGLEEEYTRAAQEAIHASRHVEGFISGESLVEQGRADRRLVVTQWRNLSAWKCWYASDARAAAMQHVFPLLTGDETIRAFVPGDA